MDKMNLGSLNMKSLVDDLTQKLDDAANRLQQEGQEAGEAVGRGWDEGINDTVEKIKASSIKTDKAFKNLSEKIKKQVQQLSTNIGGKDAKIKIDFSDIDMNSDDIKKQIEKKIKSIKVDDVIDFDTKGFDNQLTNFVTLFVKYQEKLKSLKQVYPNISVPKDAINNLQQQLALTTELKQMHKLLNQPIALQSGANPKMILKDLSKLQQFTDNTKPQSVGEYEELAEVLKEIQSSLKIVSDTFKNEKDSMKVMAENGKTSFESFAQAIIAVYNNLTQVQSLVDNISKKDFNITNTIQFDEIYAKFDELRNNISTMKIDVGIDTTNIKTAIQEALYAKEIAANYKAVEFEDIYEAQFGKGTWTNRWTGEVFDTFDDAYQDFDTVLKGLFKSKEGYFLGTKEEMFTDFLNKQSIDTAPEQENWAQVVVEAINTQGGRIVESIKLLLPKNISESVDTIDEKELTNAFQVLVNAISDFGDATGRKPRGFFESIKTNDSDAHLIKTPEVNNALRTLGLLSDSGEVAFTIPDTGIRNLGVAIADKVVATSQNSGNVDDASELMKKLDEASKLGASVPRILSLIEKDNIPLGMSDRGEAVFQLQTRSPGVNVASSKANNEFLNATDEQIDRLIHTFEVMSKVGLYPDFIGDNILFDKQKGFSLIDLETSNIDWFSDMDDSDDMVREFLGNLQRNGRQLGIPLSEMQDFGSRVKDRANLNPEQRLVNDRTIATERMAVSQTKTESKPSEVKITPIMDEGAIAKVVADNVVKTPATVKVTPVVDSASNTEQAVDGESQSAVDAAKSFVDAANAKKQFVEANKQVAKSAEESAGAVEEEAKAAEQTKQTMTAIADDTIQPSNWDKISQLQTDHGEDPFALSRSKTENVGDESVRTIVESWSAIKDEDGNLTGEMELNTVKIINDFKKRTDAVTKENEKIKTAQAYLQKFLTQFDNKTMGKGSLLAGYQDLVGLANSPDFKIDDIAKAEQMMSNLDAEYNKVVQSMRKGSSSMNPFVNAINGIDKMEDVLRGISLQFKTLNQQPDWLKEDIVGLYKQLDNVTAETDIYKFAEGFGNLKVSINSVTESLRQQRVEQKLTTSDFKTLVQATKTRDTNTEKAAKEEDGSVWKTYYLDRAADQQKMIDTIRIGLTLTEEQETQLNAMAEKHALILGDITRENNKIEEQKQKYEEIMRLLEKNRADQIELDNDKTLDTADRSEYQQILNQERAKIEALIANTDLNSEQKKSVNTSLGLIEDDRVAKVKKYIDLLKLQYDYEKKAAKEDDGSKMQSFYNDNVAKVKEKIKNVDIQILETQDEKNKRLALEEAHQRAIAEILAKRSNAQPKNQDKEKDKALFIPQDKKVQERYEAGYLNKGQYDNWQRELIEYQNYMNGIAHADEATIKNKKQSLMQMYDMLTKMSNASKSFFASGGEILPKEMWFDKNQIDDASISLQNLYNNIATERFEGMKTSVVGVNGTLGTLNFVVDDGAGNLTQYTIALNKATGATKLLEKNTKPTLTVLQKFGQSLKKDFTGLLTAVMGGTSIHTFVQYMRQGIQSVRELDLALTELKKVTDDTEETYDRFLDTAASTSARIGSTLSNMTSATAEFAKLGYEIETAAAMAESALVYTNVGDNVDVETGSQSIISTMKAFGIEANNTMSIVDKFNEVGNNFAITTKGIGDALQVSASAMAAAGNTLDETIALTTAANTIVQNPNTVGTALKTLSLRIRGVKTELQEAGLETEGMAETTSQLQQKLLALTDGKVNIMVDENNFKNTTQILREISAEWENLTDVEQAAALELLGGKRQANTLSAIISNFDIVEDAIEASANSSGSALEENEKVLDSIQGRINLFNNALQTLWSNILDDDLIKNVVSYATEIIQSLDTTHGKILAIVKAVALLMAYKKINPLDWIPKIAETFNTIKNTDGGIKQFLGSLIGIAPAIKTVTAETVANTVAMQTNNVAEQQAILQKMGLTRATGVLNDAKKKEIANNIALAVTNGQMTTQMGQQMAAMLGYTISVDAAGVATATLDATTKSFMATNPIGWILAIISVIMTVVTLLSQIPSKTERITEKLENFKSEISDIQSELDSLNTELETTQSRMAELLAMDSLSFTEQEELQRLQLQNEELERQVELQKQLLKSKEQERIDTAKEWIDNVWNGKDADKQYAVSPEGVITEDKWDTSGVSGKDALDNSLEQYKSLKEETSKVEEMLNLARQEYDTDGKLSKATQTAISDFYQKEGIHTATSWSAEDSIRNLENRVKINDTDLSEMQTGINMVLRDMANTISENELQYGDDTEINKYLDEYYAMSLKWQGAQGAVNKSDIIKHIFSDSTSEGTQNLKEQLDEIAASDLDSAKKQSKAQKLIQDAIDNTDGDYQRLKTTIDTLDISVEELAKSFVAVSTAPDISTFGGVLEVFADGEEILRKFNDKQAQLGLDENGEAITWGNLFKEVDGEKVVDNLKVAAILEGADESVRDQFTRLIEEIESGKMSVDEALANWEMVGIDKAVEALNTEFESLNNEMFSDAADEISGLIDSVNELKAAFESVASAMDLLHTAQTQFNNSGRVSVKTALEIMSATDEWDKVLTITEDSITLADGAEQALIQTQLDAIATQSKRAVELAKTKYEAALTAQKAKELADAERDVAVTQNNANTVTNQRTNQMGDLATQTYNTAISELDYAGNDGVVQTAESVKAKAVGLVSASIIGLDAAIQAFTSSSFGSKFENAAEAWSNSYNEARNAVIADANSYTTTVSQLKKDYEKKRDVANVAANADKYGEFRDNYDFDKTPGDKYKDDSDSDSDDKDDAFQKEMDYWENRIAANQARSEQIQNEIDLLEKQGKIVGEEYYQEQIRLENERLQLLEAQKAAALRFLGTFEKGSEEWWEAAKIVNDIEGEIDDVTASIQDMNDAMADIDWQIFDETHERYGTLIDDLETIRDLMAPNGEENWFDDNGQWTEEGVAVLGTYIQQTEMYKNALDEVNKKLKEYSKPYKGNEKYYKNLGIDSEQELYDAREKLNEQQKEYIKGISDSEQAALDMYESQIDAIEEYTDKLVDSYNEYIDLVREALDAERD